MKKSSYLCLFVSGVHNIRHARGQMWPVGAFDLSRKSQNSIYLTCLHEKTPFECVKTSNSTGRYAQKNLPPWDLSCAPLIYMLFFSILKLKFYKISIFGAGGAFVTWKWPLPSFGLIFLVSLGWSKFFSKLLFSLEEVKIINKIINLMNKIFVCVQV